MDGSPHHYDLGSLSRAHLRSRFRSRSLSLPIPGLLLFRRFVIFLSWFRRYFFLCCLSLFLSFVLPFFLSVFLVCPFPKILLHGPGNDPWDTPERVLKTALTHSLTLSRTRGQRKRHSVGATAEMKSEASHKWSRHSCVRFK